MRTEIKHKHSKKTTAGESGLASCSPMPDPGTVNSDPPVASYMTYAEQLKSPKWQKKRLEILERDGFTCRNCFETDKQLHVHHLFYLRDKKVWEYPDTFYFTLCEECHKEVHEKTEQLYRSIANIYSEELGMFTISNYIDALRVASHMSDVHVGAFRARAEYWDTLPF